MLRQKLIIIDGLNGAGKSTVANLLHKQLPNTALISFDQVKFLISDFSRTQEQIKTTDAVVRQMAKTYLNKGFNVIIEAHFPDKSMVEKYVKSIKNQSVKLYVFQLEALPQIRYQRIKKRPLSEGTKRKMDKKWLDRNDLHYSQNKYPKGIVIDTSKSSPKKIVHQIIYKLK